MSARKTAANILTYVIKDKKSLAPLIDKIATNPDKALIQELCFGVCRYYFQLKVILNKLMSKPLKAKDIDVDVLLLLGLYQCIYMRIPNHAAVSETVSLCKKPWAKKLINAILRNFIREQDNITAGLESNESYKFAHPAWFVDKLKHCYPDTWQTILSENNQHPPLTLRINQNKISREEYIQLLDNPAKPHLHNRVGIILEKALAINKIPKFKHGYVSVQDGAAQLAADILPIKAGDIVLDACAAPGGKTCHLLEKNTDINVTALEIESLRAEKIKENLLRLNLHAEIMIENAATITFNESFDAILLDAPCSATGIIRRHPDIKLLRQATDIAKLAKLQRDILQNLWLALKPNSHLLYATCSIMPEENTETIEWFLKNNLDAKEIKLDVDWGIAEKHGRQILPGTSDMDGFYYCLLQKS